MDKQTETAPEHLPFSPDEAIEQLRKILRILESMTDHNGRVSAQTPLPKVRVLLRGIIGCGIRADTRTRSPLADEGAAVNARFNRVYASQQKARDTRLARKLLTGWGHEPVEGAIKEVAAALEAARSASTPSTRAHVEGCTKALSVPVDLCECGGRVITWPTPVAGADNEKLVRFQIARRIRDFIFAKCKHSERDRMYDYCPDCVLTWVDSASTPAVGADEKLVDEIIIITGNDHCARTKCACESVFCDHWEEVVRERLTALLAPPPTTRENCRGNETGFHTCGLPIGGCGVSTPPAVAQACVKCPHRGEVSAEGFCQHPATICGCKCEFAAVAQRPVDDDKETT